MALDRLVDRDIYHVHVTFINIHICAIFKDDVLLSHLPIS